ncbi:energy transducer TonB [Photobacterium sp. TY1-4]|uniref:energy transducer TonB n=1 Tax=Photobacterium sp. TY1-4 TaxID=2899122 RepID=UPI0021C1FB64|nr:energy transducer TonB [Photobacterium sp. TY1-4]UXI04266.1 energy transducer TonB [Photobacterium sp. TY1-4]
MLRLLMALPAALAMALGLFTLMAWMVDNGDKSLPEDKPMLAFDMVMVEQDTEIRRRQRAVPPQPDMPEPPPQATPAASQQAVTASIAPTMPNLSLDTAVTGVQVEAPQFSDFGTNQQAMPLYRVEPNYPARAQKRGMEGYVVLSFTIDPNGRPTDIQVLDAKPRRIFEREAVQALRRWKYQPKVVDGAAIAQVGQTIRLEFKLNQ